MSTTVTKKFNLSRIRPLLSLNKPMADMATPCAEQTAREFLRAAPRTRRSLEMMRVPSTGAPTGTPSREDARRSQELDPRLELELTQTRRTENMLLQKQLNDATSGGAWSLQVAIAPSALEPAARVHTIVSFDRNARSRRFSASGALRACAKRRG